MKTKSSPGPWYLRHAFGKYELSYDDDMIADMKMSGLPEDADNARLISAAPDLLEALKKVAQSLEWHAHGCCRGFDDGAPLPTNEAVELAKRTIAKAIGNDG